MRQDERDTGGRQPADAERGRQTRAPARDPLMQEIEASETDGKGTGGVGADAGGYEPLPEE